MRAVPFDSPGKGVLELPEISVSFSSINSKREDFEPTSVLDTQRSPSPPTSSLGGSVGVAAFSDDPWPQEDLSAAGKVTDSGSRKEDWAADLQPIPSSLEIGGGKCGLGMEEDWENMLSSSPGHEHSLFRWVMGDFEDPLKHLLEPGAPINPSMHVNESMNMLTSSMATTGTDLVPLNTYSSGKIVADSNEMQTFKGSLMGGNNNWSNQMNPIFSPDHGNKNNLNLPVQPSLHPGVLYHDQEPQNFNPHHQQQLPHANQNPALALPICYGQQEHDPFPHRAKRLHSFVHVSNTPYSQSGEEAFLGRQQQDERYPNVVLPLHPQHRKPKVGDEASMAHLQQQQQALVDQLFRAAELVGAGNPTHAQGILARLNHQLPSPVGKPLQRAAFYFKEALQLLLNPTPKAPFSHLDAAFKISAYKVFLEMSPLLQFTHFTSNQVLLEALDGFNQIHILDFDMGLGGQWAPFMQELALKHGRAPSLKITAFVSPSTHDPLELGLIEDNLTLFAANLNISFEFSVINLDSLDTLYASLNILEKEAIAVNFPLGPTSNSVSSLLNLVKQLNPKIVVTVERGSDRSDLPFSHHIVHALQSYTMLFDSLDAANVNSGALQKIERFLLYPRIESIVTWRRRAGDQMLSWRHLLASAGFSPIPFSKITETQAECIVKKLQVGGFQVEKRQYSLHLLWQRGDLVSISAWRC